MLDKLEELMYNLDNLIKQLKSIAANAEGTEEMKMKKFEKFYEVKSVREAWAKVNELFPTDYHYDSERSYNAGYPIYYTTSSMHHALWVSDLGDRLEVNLMEKDYGYVSFNVWINEETQEDRIRKLNEQYGVRIA